MKILMVNKFLYPRGGAESYMLKLGEQLTKLGHEVMYFGMYDAQNTVGNSLHLSTQNMDFHSGSFERFLYPFKILYSTEAKRKIGRVLDDFEPDIVHLNNINFQLTPSIFYAIKKRHIPLVQTVHDYQMICPNHLMYSFREEQPCTRCVSGSKWNCARYSCIHGSKVKSILGTLEAMLYSAWKTYRLVDLYICPSHFLENKLLSASPLYQGKTYTLHNFINQMEEIGQPVCEQPYIAFVGRLSREKGIDLLAQTAKLLPEYQFAAAGNGPDAGMLEGQQNIRLTGFLNGSELTGMIANAKLLVVPSVCFENCPLSILEAHALGVPVVTMNSGGMAELVDDGVTGTLVQVPDAEHLAAAIRKTVEDEAYYQQLKENCRKYREEILTVDRYCEKLMEQYQNLIAGRKNREGAKSQHHCSGI